MGYEVVKYRPEFREGVLKLLEMLWSSSHAVNDACFEWKHERNPYLSQPLLYLALHSGRVVGMRGICGAKWEAGSPRREFLTPCACDLVVAPDHRNRGVISRIMRFALDDLRRRGFEYILNLSAGPVTFMNSLAMGWRSTGPVGVVGLKAIRETRAEQLKRVLARWPPALSFARSVKNLPFLQACTRPLTFPSSVDVAAPFSHLDENLRHSAGRGSRRVWLSEQPQPEAMADLVQRIGGDGRIRHVRDRRYFAWRYRNPLHAYRFLYCGQSRLEGYLVLQARAHSPHRIYPTIEIPDWEATGPMVFDDLLTAAIRCGDFEEMRSWEKVWPAHARNALEKARFRPHKLADSKLEYGPTVLVRSMANTQDPAEWRLAGAHLLDPSRWDLRPVYAL